MPKSNLCKPDYMLASEKLIKWIKRQEKQTVIAKALRMSPQRLSYKLNHNALDAVDLLRIFHFLDSDPDEILKVMRY